MKPIYLLAPAITGGLIAVAGLIFKLMHWPYGQLMLLIGVAMILLSAFLILLTAVLKNKR